MSLSNLLQEFDVFTTRVKSKTVPSLYFTTSTLLVEIKSLRYNIIPIHHLLLVLLFFIVPELKFLLHELDEKSDQKNQNFEKFLVCKNGLGGHEPCQ